MIIGAIGTATAVGVGVGACASSRNGGGAPAGTPAPSSGLITTPVDSSAGAKQGGTFRSFLTADVPTFDVLSTNSIATLTQFGSFTYPRLLKFKAGKYPDRATGDVEPDLAESYELTNDRLQVTFHIRQGLKWEDRPPTKARPIDAQDVMFSWNKFLKASPSKGEMAYDALTSPGGAVDTVVQPDPRTIVVKLKQPISSILGLFASDRLFKVMPRESDGGFDPRVEVRGYGPWLIVENTAGSFRAWSRNPDYYFKGRPYFDRLEQAILSEYPARVAEFRAGNIWSSVVSQTDVIRTKKDLPALLLEEADNFATTTGSLAFGYDGDAPWKDDRLRQAVSLLIDRESLIDVNSSRASFSAEGLDVAIRYHSVVPAGWDGWWIDPTDAGKFGPNAMFYSRDPDEAQKLLSAAGFPDGLDTQLHYSSGSQYGALYARTAELVSGMLIEGSVRAQLAAHDFQNDWLPNYALPYAAAANPGRPTRGFSGIAYRFGAPHPMPAEELFALLHKDGAQFEGMTPDGKNPQLGDPDVNKAIEAIRREPDLKHQQELAQDFARLMARKAYSIPMQPFSALGFNLSWPVIGNLGVFRPWPAGSPPIESAIHYWIDTSRPPLGTAS